MTVDRAGADRQSRRLPAEQVPIDSAGAYRQGRVVDEAACPRTGSATYDNGVGDFDRTGRSAAQLRGDGQNLTEHAVDESW